MRKKVTAVGTSAAIILSKDLLAQMQVEIGDEVEITMMDRTLVARPASEVERAKEFARISDDIFSRRSKLMKKLAE